MSDITDAAGIRGMFTDHDPALALQTILLCGYFLQALCSACRGMPGAIYRAPHKFKVWCSRFRGQEGWQQK